MLILDKFHPLTFGAALAAIATFPSHASASTLTVDSFVETGTITDGVNTPNASVDYWLFDVAAAGPVTIDILSRFVLAGDGSTGLSNLDSQIFVFDFDASGDLGLLGNLVATNDDDSSAPALTDGTVDNFDSYLVATLDIGSYALAISDYFFSEAEARAGENDSNFDGTFGDYQITFGGIDLPAVPLPAGLPLMLGGFGALSFLRRKKSK